MPKTPAHKQRSGDSARGAARINQDDELPNTKSGEWADKFAGTSTADVLGDDENGALNPSYKEVATSVKRPLAARAGGGHTSGGKCPKTMQRRLAGIMDVLKAEADRAAKWQDIEERCKHAMSDPETLIVPEGERLGYSQIHMYIKFHACCNAIEYVWGNRKKVRAARAAAAQPLASAIALHAALSSSAAVAHTPLE